MTTPKPQPTITLELFSGFHCSGCSTVYDPEQAELPPLWECSNGDCGEQFTAEDRACPSCNRPFSRKLADHACEDCAQEVEPVQYIACPGCGDPVVCKGCDEVVSPEQEIGIKRTR